MAALDPDGAPVRRFVTFKDRFVELELGETLIGRGEHCPIQLIHPLVSRHHARIVCDANQSIIEDLGSRNGTRLNGKFVERPRPLRHGDRVQIGSHELVYTEMGASPSTTLPAVAITEAQHPDQIWGAITDVAWKGPVDRTNTTGRWPLEMLIELLGRSILAQRERDVAGLMKQAMAAVDDMLNSANPIDATHLQALWEAAMWLTKVQRNSSWIIWAQSAYRRANLPEPLLGPPPGD
jgi:FHA domain